MKINLVLILFLAASAFCQQAPAPAPGTSTPATKSEVVKPSATTDTTAKADAGKPGTPHKAPDRAAAYYHYSMAHIYEELVSLYNRSDLANKALEEYKLAIEADPDSAYLNAGLAELYFKTGRIRDAVLEAQDLLKRDPNNLEAHKLLGHIYLRSLGDTASGNASQDMLKLAIDQYEQIVKIDPSSVEDHMWLGRLYSYSHELVKAEKEFKTAAQLDPSNSEEPITALAYLYTEEGDTAKAAQVLSSVPEDQRSGKLYQALGYAYEQQHDYKKAIDAYRNAVEQDKENLDALRGLAQNLLNDGQTDAALQQYKIVADADPQDATSQIRIAEIYRRTGKFDSALESLKKAESVVPDMQEVPYNRALVYEAQGRYGEAATLLNQLLQRQTGKSGNLNAAEKNNRSVFLERLAAVYRENSKPQLALESYRKMLDLGEDAAVRGYDGMIETYRDNKQWQEATNMAQEAVKKEPNSRSLKLVFAGQLADSGKPDEAIAMAKGLLKGTPEDREVYVDMAQIDMRLKRWKDAEDSLAKAGQYATKPEEKDFDNYMLGSIYERQKKYDEAEALFKHVIASDPNNAAAFNYLGYMLADRGVRLDEALGYIRKAIELDPQRGEYLDSLGWVYFKMGNYELAEENLRKASDKINNDGTIQDHLGDLFNKTGRLKQAAAHWERALEEWNKSIPAEVEPSDVAKVQKKLEGAKVKLAKEGAAANKQ